MRLRLPTVVLTLAAISAAATAQTGNDLYKVCSGTPQEKIGCDLYIAGFLHGLQASQDAPGAICLPSELMSGTQAANIFLEFMSDVALAAAIKKQLDLDQNPFFTAPQSHSLFGVFAMKFPCKK